MSPLSARSISLPLDRTSKLCFSLWRLVADFLATDWLLAVNFASKCIFIIIVYASLVLCSSNKVCINMKGLSYSIFWCRNKSIHSSFDSISMMSSVSTRYLDYTFFNVIIHNFLTNGNLYLTFIKIVLHPDFYINKITVVLCRSAEKFADVEGQPEDRHLLLQVPEREF